MKTLKQIQEENRKFIIMANNPTAKTYEEALEMELGYGCIVLLREGGVHRIGDEDMSLHKEDRYVLSHKNYCEGCPEPRKIGFQIIGKPLTLSRVLISIRKHFEFFKNYNKLLNNNHILEFENPDKDSEILLSWDLTKETLEEQSEETQREINKLLN